MKFDSGFDSIFLQNLIPIPVSIPFFNFDSDFDSTFVCNTISIPVSIPFLDFDSSFDSTLENSLTLIPTSIPFLKPISISNSFFTSISKPTSTSKNDRS